jgi:adenylate kinase
MSKPQFNLTLIAGLSGVGKTFIINEIMRGDSKFIHFSAGYLIKKRRQNVSHDELRLLDSNEILQNQHLLIDQLNIEKIAIDSGVHILFDAHMIIDTDNELVEIPFEIFDKLTPSRMVFLHAVPKIILERRVNDTSRVRPVKTIAEIQSQQDRSGRLAQEYCNKLSIEFIHHTFEDKVSLIDKIQ